MRKPLTESDLMFIRENMGRLTNKQIAKSLGRYHSVISYHTKAFAEGITRRRFRHLSENEKTYILDNRDKLSIPKIAANLGRNPATIYSHIKAADARARQKMTKLFYAETASRAREVSV